MVLLIGLAAMIATFLGGLFALRLGDRMHLILGFSAGAVIGVAFFDLLPESLELVSPVYDPAHALALTALGFTIYLILDRMIILHRHHEHHGHEHAHAQRGTWGAGTLSVHSFLDGMGIGLAFQVSTAVGIIVAVAVLAHDFSDGINTVSMVVKSGGERLRAMRWLMADAIAPFLGVVSTLFFTVSGTTLGLILAIFSGFFLYIGASELLPESHHAHPVRWTTFATVIGIGFMYVIIRLAV